MPARRYRRARARPRRRVVRRRTPVRRKRTITPRRPMSRMLTKYELAQVNPFDKQVQGVKIPDSNTMPSDTAFVEDRITVSTGATDLAKAVAFFPNVGIVAQPALDGTSTSWTWPVYGLGASASSQLANFTSSFSGIRPCGHGIRLSSQLAPTSATGFVHIAIYPLPTYTSTTYLLPLNLSQMTQLSWYRRVTLASLTQRSCTVVNKFIDNTATRYSAPGSDLLASSDDQHFQFGSGWCAILIAVEGAPLNTGVLSVENITHFETLQLRGAAGSQSPAAEYNVRELEDVSRISGQGNAIFLEGEEPNQIRQATSILARGIQAIGNMVLPQSSYTSYTGGGIQGINTGRLMQY